MKKLSIALIFSVLCHLMFLSLPVKQIIFPTSKLKIKKLAQKRLKVKLKGRQVVSTESSKKNEVPEDPKYLSNKSNKFDKQVVSKNIASFKKAGKGVATGVKKVIYAKAQNKKTPPKITLKDLSMIKPKFKEFKKGTKKGQKRLITLGQLNGLANTVGLSASNDYVDDIPLDDMTNLNTLEYKYFGFMDRIKKQLEQFWGVTLKNKVKKMLRGGRRPAFAEDKITSLLIQLDTHGNILEVAVKHTSGIKELDDAAVESFKKAGPFPNPPKGLIKNGNAVLRWSFVVKS
ncbi:MAG: energy transducer TonB [Bacteriovoracaceae bacterium]|nr:energy transducer TonB [Bacteriovoracaceae bacterium]